eukprot:TRINITY_DN8409_c1_g1_i6.p1 TRINITY_DN8409_c1_g1~~TRINITY_DN8409_c1_g1_i6.p1  ORF type:complete len:603 (+),score=143.01 TRINITY_DN8409_c1_g1_i6:1-1809(+)
MMNSFLSFPHKSGRSRSSSTTTPDARPATADAVVVPATNAAAEPASTRTPPPTDSGTAATATLPWAEEESISGRYITNSGSVLTFDLQACNTLFGVSFGQRIQNVKGNKSGTVVGVRNTKLWVHIDGEKGARMVPYKNKKEFRKSGWERWLPSATISSRTSEPIYGRARSLTETAPLQEGETVTFVVEGKRIFANKDRMLSNVYFRSLLTSGMRESTQKEIELHADIRHDIFNLIVMYLESPCKDSSFISEENDLELLAAADLFQINDLRMDCFMFIQQSISPTTSIERLVDILQASHFYRLPQLEDAVVYQFFHMQHDDGQQSTPGSQAACAIAIQKGYQDVATLLVRTHGAEWRRRRASLADELRGSAERGFPVEFARLLLDHAEDPKRTLQATDSAGNNALHIACMSVLANAFSLAEFFVMNGVPLNCANIKGETPLMQATQRNNTDIVTMLLQSGADPNLCDRSKSTPLHVAVSCKYYQIVKPLLESKATCLDVRDESGAKPLGPLAYRGPTELLTMLRTWDSSGKAIDSVSAQTRLIHWLASQRCYNLVKIMLEQVGINCVDFSGETLLLKACRAKSLHAVRYASHTTILHGIDDFF